MDLKIPRSAHHVPGTSTFYEVIREFERRFFYYYYDAMDCQFLKRTREIDSCILLSFMGNLAQGLCMSSDKFSPDAYLRI